MADGQIRYKVGFDIQKKGLDQLKASLQDLQRMKISDIMKINGSTVSEAKAIFSDIQKDAATIERALNKAFSPKLNALNIEQFNRELNSSTLSLNKIYEDFSKAGASGEAAFRRLSTQLLGVNVQLKQSHTILDKMATTLANTIKWNAASGAVNGLTRSVQQAWGYVKALDGSLNDIRIVTGKSADDMANFAVQANNAAKELGRTTTDYTNAALIFAQQGLSDAEVEQRARITLKAANVTGQSTDAVSEQLTAVWNGYKVTAEEAQLYVDRLAAVAATTASDLEELSTGMSKVASAAAAMGVGEDQLAAQLSTIISVTRQAPESVGTALRTVYARISDIEAGIEEDGVTLGKYSGEMEALGFNVLDASGHLRDMGEVMQEIGSHWADLTREQQISLAQTMAGQRQYSNLIALFDNFEKYDEALYTAQNAAGTLQKQQDIAMESMSAHLNVLKASMEDIYDSIIDNDALDSIKGLVDVLANVATGTAKVMDGIGGGASLLRDLGAIAVTVFSQQIAGGITTTINNFERAELQAKAFADAIAQAKKMQEQGVGNDYTKRLIAQQEALLNIGQRISPQAFSEIQNKLQELSQVSGDKEIAQEKIDLLRQSFKALGEDIELVSAKYGGLDQMLASADGIEEVKAALQNLDKSFQPIREKQKEMSQAFTEFYSDITSGSSTAKDSLDKLKGSVQNFIDSLKTTTLGDSGLTFFDTLPENAKRSVEEAQKSLNDINFSKGAEQASSQILSVYQNLNRAITSEINSIRKMIENADKGQMQGLQEKLKSLLALQKQIQDEYETLKARSQRTITAQDLVAMAGGVAQIGSAVRQLSNIGSIIEEKDISGGERFFKVITNLAISLPMLATGIGRVGKSLNLLNYSLKGSIAQATAAMTAEGAHGIALGGLGVAATDAGMKFQFLNMVVEMNPFVAAATAAIALATALGMAISYMDKARKEAIEADNAEIESLNKQQEKIDQQQAALKELNDKYREGTLTRGELKEAVSSLIQEYGFEEQEIDRLIHKYGGLEEAIKNARGEKAQEGWDSATAEKEKADNVVLNTAKGTMFDRGRQVGDQYSLDAGLVAGSSMPEEVVSALKQAGATFSDMSDGGMGISFDTDFDAESIVGLYDKITAALQKMKDAGLDGTQVFKNLNGWLEQMRPAAEEYKAAADNLAQYGAQIAGFVNNQFDDIDTAQQYAEKRKELINSVSGMLEDQGLSSDSAVATADEFLRQQYGDLYNQYDDYSRVLDQIQEKFGQADDKFKEALANLSPNQLAALEEGLNLHGDTLDSWQQLVNFATIFESKDFSNVDKLGKVSLDEMQKNASEQYVNYQGVQDQVAKGGTISAQSYEGLDSTAQQYFSIMADGTYKMTGNAKEFQAAMDSLKIEGFQKAIGDINQQLNKISIAKNVDTDQISQSALVDQNVGGTVSQTFDKELVDQQLAYLDAVYAGNDAMAARLEYQRQELENGENVVNVCKDIQDQVLDAIDAGKKFGETQEELTKKAEELQHQMHDALFPTDTDVDSEALAKKAAAIQEMAEESDELADSLKKDGRAAEDVAESILRFDDAIKDVTDNYDDWKDALGSKSYAKQSQAIEGLRDAYSDLLDLDGSSLSNDFLRNTQNLDLMKAAIQGDTAAYDELLARAGQDIATQVGLDTTQFDAQFNDLMAKYYQGQNLEDLEVGAELNNQGFLDGLTQMVNAAGMTAQQATDYLASMGVDAEIIEQDTQAEETQEAMGFTGSTHPITGTVNVPGVAISSSDGGIAPQETRGITTNWTYDALDVEPDPVQGTALKESKNFALKVVSAHKSSGGGFKYSQKNGGGSKGGGGGKKGKGGGRGKKKKGGSSSKADTSTKDTKKPLKDNLDIYHDINIQIGKINKNLNRTQKQQDQLYGKKLLENLEKQKELLGNHNQKLKEKRNLQIQDLANQRKALQSLGVTFDKLGNINNYMTVLQGKQKTVNDLINQYNKKIEQYNKSTNKTNKEKIAKEAEKISKKIEDAEDVYKDLEDKIGNYDDLREEMQDLLDQIQENTQQQIELTIQGFRTELEIRLDLGQAERDWNEFRRNVLQKTNVLKDMEFDGIFKDALKSIDDIYTYIGKEGSIGTITTLMQQLEDTQAEIEQMNKEGGISLIYGTNKAQAMEDLQSDLDQLMSQLEDIEDLVNEIDEAYLDTIDDIADQFDAQIQGYEYVGELLEHDMDLLSLLYGDKNYDAMNRYYTALVENNNKQLDFLREQANYWQQNWVKAMEEGNVQAAKEFEEHYKDTIDNLNSLISDSVENLQDKYINAIEQIFDTLDRKITNGKGMDYLGMEWDLLNKNAEDYLDTINAAFAVQDLERKYNKALGETTSIKNQRALKKVMDEQLNNLKAKDKLTQYDVDRAEKLLEIEKARIALEDVRAQKTSLRLKRDSQGNYSYEYVADMDEVAEAQEALAAAQNDLYNFDKEQYQSNVDEVLAAWQDFQSEYKDIITDLSLTEEDRVNKLKLLREQYGKYINNKTAENAIIRVNLMDSAFADLAAIYEQDVQNYMQMADEEKDIIMNQLVPAWNSGVQEMANLIINEGGFVPVCQQAFDSIAEVTEEYAKELQTLGLIAGVNFEELKEGADYVADGMASLIKQNNELISSMKMEMEAIDLLRKQAQQLSKDYNDVTKSAAAAVTKIQEFVKAQKTAAAQAAKENKPATTASKNSSSSTTSKTTSTNNSSNNSTNNKNSTSNTSSNTSSSGTSTAKKTTSELAQDIYNKLKEKVLNGGSSSDSGQNKTPQVTGGGAVRRIARLATGGYTGEWNSEEGRLAFLHEKELVLNEQDTKNVLNSVSILRTLMGSLNTTVANKIFDLNHGNRTSLLQSVGNNENVSQAVQISATFPNVNSRREIEEAFNNLVNMAAQRALE